MRVRNGRRTDGPGTVLDTCARCGPAGRGRRHASRRLCEPCDGAARRDGELHLYPRVTHRTVDLVRRACELRRQYGAPSITFGGRWSEHGMSWPAIATALGVSASALEKARERCGWPDPTAGRAIRSEAAVTEAKAARPAVQVPTPAGPPRARGSRRPLAA